MPSKSQSASAAAWYLLLTGADDPKTHTGRDLAKRACELEPTLESCGALARLALDRSEQLVALRSAAETEPSPAVFAHLARLELAAGHVDEAQGYGRKARSLGPQSLDTLLLEFELLAQAGLFNSALERARGLLSARPELPIVALHAFELSQNAQALHDAATFARRVHELAADELPPLRLLARRAALDGNIDAFERHSAIVTLLDGGSLGLGKINAMFATVTDGPLVPSDGVSTHLNDSKRAVETLV